MAGEGTGQGTGVGEVAADVADALSGFTASEAPAEGKTEGGEKPVEEGKVEEGKPTEEAAPREGEGEKPEGEEAPSELAALQAQIAQLNEKIAGLSKPPEQAEKPREELKPVKYFEKPEDFEAAFEKQETFEGLLSKVKTNAVTEVLQNIPTVIANVVKTQMTLMKNTEKFYTENKDLADKKAFVGHVANDLMGKNPGWTLDKLFGELGKEVKTRLGVKPAQGNTGKSNPGIPPRKAGGTRLPSRQAPQLEGLGKEVADLVSDEGSGIRR